MKNKGLNLAVGSVVTTRAGKTAKIISTEAKIDNGNYDVVALIDIGDGDFIEWYNSDNITDGFMLAGGRPDLRDIKVE